MFGSVRGWESTRKNTREKGLARSRDQVTPIRYRTKLEGECKGEGGGRHLKTGPHERTGDARGKLVVSGKRIVGRENKSQVGEGRSHFSTEN